MRIGIIGGGSIGLLFAAKLALAGEEVTVWTRTLEQSELIGQAGIRILDEQGVERLASVSSKVLSVESLNAAESEGLASAAYYLLALKQTDLTGPTIELIVRLIGLTPGKPALICLQNGTGHLQKFVAASQGKFAVYNAVTSAGAKRIDGRSVHHTGEGPLFLANRAEARIKAGDQLQHSYEMEAETVSEDAIRQKKLLSVLIRAGFEASLSNHIHNRVFQKLLINAIINPLTALFDITNGELPAHPSRLALMKTLHDETASILYASGMEEWTDSWVSVLGVCGRTSSNVSSMLADVRSGRRTEIDSINGEIVRIGFKHGIKAPLNESMLRLIEALYSGDAASGDR
ncbi:ketopantoate reductase family protein [Paenibacillus sp. strain BS8-2]